MKIFKNYLLRKSKPSSVSCADTFPQRWKAFSALQYLYRTIRYKLNPFLKIFSKNIFVSKKVLRSSFRPYVTPIISSFFHYDCFSRKSHRFLFFIRKTRIYRFLHFILPIFSIYICCKVNRTGNNYNHWTCGHIGEV